MSEEKISFAALFRINSRKIHELFENLQFLPLLRRIDFMAWFRTVSSLWYNFSVKMKDLNDRFHVWFGAYRIMYNWSEEDRDLLLQWVRSKAPGCSVKDFSQSWKNGLILVALLEGIVPHSCNCSQYHILNPIHNIQNVELAFSMAKKYLRVYPTLTPKEVTAGKLSNEKKLIHYLVLLKVAMSRHENTLSPEEQLPQDQDPLFRNQPCLAKGIGLMTARKGKPAKFNLYTKHIGPMDIIVAIRGPGEDFCSRRITNRSPRRHKSGKPLILNSPEEKPSTVVMNINLDYEIIGRKISVTYTPLSVGNHQLSIYWQGRHLEDSPYTVTVDESFDSEVIQPTSETTTKKLMPTLNSSISETDPSVSTDASDVHQMDQADQNKKTGKVIRRKILRQVVLRNGSEIELQQDKPLPFDPKAWCGESCHLVNNSLQDISKHSSTRLDELLTKNRCKKYEYDEETYES